MNFLLNIKKIILASSPPPKKKISATIIDFRFHFVRPGSIIAEFSVTFSGEEEIDPILLDQDINAFAQSLPEAFTIDHEFTSHAGK